MTEQQFQDGCKRFAREALKEFFAELFTEEKRSREQGHAAGSVNWHQLEKMCDLILAGKTPYVPEEGFPKRMIKRRTVEAIRGHASHGDEEALLAMYGPQYDYLTVTTSAQEREKRAEGYHVDNSAGGY
jgi:hypothetical protein